MNQLFFAIKFDINTIKIHVAVAWEWMSKIVNLF